MSAREQILAGLPMSRPAALPTGPAMRMEGDLVTQFIANLRMAQAQVTEVTDEAEAVAAMRTLSPEAPIYGLDTHEPVTLGARVSFSRALFGIAESGACVLASGPDHATANGFFVDTSCIFIRRADIVATYEDAWARLREMGPMARAVNFIAGPSSTADVGLQLVLGSHGPRTLAVFLAA